jgi:pimeloyl-ACP methyl ester carboxylesterase
MLLHHVDLGGAGRPPLLVLHGLLGSSRNWQTTGRDLAARYHVFAPDARNHGRSPHAADMSAEAMMEDVIAWMDAQGLSRASVAGHSMGGRTAMLLACRHPERVAKLVVVDVAPRDYDPRSHAAEFAAMNELDLSTLRSRQEAEVRWQSRVPDPGMRKFLATNLAQDAHGCWHWSINLPALTAALPELAKDPLTPTDRYDGPALFITGGKSNYVRSEDHAAILCHFPNARIETIAGAGHNPHMDRRGDFLRLVLPIIS